MPSSQAFDSYFLSFTASNQGCKEHATFDGGSILQRSQLQPCKQEQGKSETVVADGGVDGSKKTLRACERCRRLKQKCDSGRPCGPCIKRGWAGTCVEWDKSRALSKKLEETNDHVLSMVQRPLPWRQAVVQSHPASQNSPEAALGSSREFVRTAMRNFGVCNTAVSDVMAAMPSELCDALEDLIGAAGKWTPFFSDLCCSGRRLIPGGAGGRLDAHPGVGYVKCVADMSGSDVSWSFQINEFYCHIMSAHPEELLTRLQYCDLEMPLSRLDQLCWIVDSLDLSSARVTSSSVLSSERFAVMSNGRGSPVLARMSTRITTDAHGRATAIERFLQPLSAEEYDMHCRLTPHLCRPFMLELGDTRGGQALLAAYERERWQSLAEVSSSASGQALLCRLASHVRDRTARLRAAPPLPAPGRGQGAEGKVEGSESGSQTTGDHDGERGGERAEKTTERVESPAVMEGGAGSTSVSGSPSPGLVTSPGDAQAWELEWDDGQGLWGEGLLAELWNAADAGLFGAEGGAEVGAGEAIGDVPGGDALESAWLEELQAEM